MRLWLIDAPSEISDPIRKRYNQFLELHEKLLMLGHQDLPAFPGKKFLFMTERDTEERQRGLDLYLKTLVNRKDTRNS